MNETESPRPFAFLTAVAAEASVLRARLGSAKPLPGQSGGAGELEVATLLQDRVIYLGRTGPGEDRAARAVRRLAALRVPPRAIILVGCAGGLTSDQKVGDVVLCTRALADGVAGGVEPDAELLERLEAALRAGSIHPRRGPTVTVARVAGASGKAAIARANPGALAVAMEDRGLARTANELGLPWAAIRVILDPLEVSVPAAAAGFVSPSGETRMGRAIAHLALNPRALPGFLELGKASAVVAERVAAIVGVIAQRA